MLNISLPKSPTLRPRCSQPPHTHTQTHKHVYVVQERRVTSGDVGMRSSSYVVDNASMDAGSCIGSRGCDCSRDGPAFFLLFTTMRIPARTYTHTTNVIYELFKLHLSASVPPPTSIPPRLCEHIPSTPASSRSDTAPAATTVCVCVCVSVCLSHL